MYLGDRKDDDIAGLTLAGIFFSILCECFVIYQWNSNFMKSQFIAVVNSYMLLTVLLYQRKLKRMNEEPEINIVMYL